jgi:hypothetical protein
VQPSLHIVMDAGPIEKNNDCCNYATNFRRFKTSEITTLDLTMAHQKWIEF